MPTADYTIRLQRALEARTHLLDAEHCTAFRLFAGFYEGLPELVVDLYARTLVLFDYHASPQEDPSILDQVQDHYLSQLPWIECVIQKKRRAPNQSSRRGMISFGTSPAQQIKEQGLIYAIDLLMHQDTSFYIDTRNLRGWLLANASNWHLLNTFAYTGSLGVAALAGGAFRVIQTDRSKKFLALARQSAMRNHLDLGKMKLSSINFFDMVSHLKREPAYFDCVILDPPFFSSTSKGTVDLVNESTRLINKVRPLVKDGGYLVAINNSLFLSGTEYLKSLETLCQDGYLSIQQTIPVPEDITGFRDTITASPPRDPAPFNHPTKIVILEARRKT